MVLSERVMPRIYKAGGTENTTSRHQPSVTKMNYLTVICALSGLTLCLAQGDLRPYDVTSQRLFDNNDVDKDREFSLAELHLSFEGYDSNFDGVISREEYTTYETHLAPAMFVLTHALYDIYDQDKNGVLTEYDYKQLYNLWDTNDSRIFGSPSPPSCHTGSFINTSSTSSMIQAM